MAEAASRDLRNNTRSLLSRVEAGEDITIKVGGRPVALLTGLGRRSQWLNRAEFVQRFRINQADSNLTEELRILVPETTDDLVL